MMVHPRFLLTGVAVALASSLVLTAAPTPQQPPASQAPQQHYQQAPGNAQWMYNVRTTADGIPLASWGKRLGAWIIDGIILGIGSYLLIRAAVPGYIDSVERVIDAAAAQNTAPKNA